MRFSTCAVEYPSGLAAIRHETMRRSRLALNGLIVLGSAALGLAAFADNISLPERNLVPSASFRPDAATHETRIGSQGVLEVPNANEITPQIETVSSAPSTTAQFRLTVFSDDQGANRGRSGADCDAAGIEERESVQGSSLH